MKQPRFRMLSNLIHSILNVLMYTASWMQSFEQLSVPQHTSFHIYKSDDGKIWCMHSWWLSDLWWSRTLYLISLLHSRSCRVGAVLEYFHINFTFLFPIRRYSEKGYWPHLHKYACKAKGLGLWESWPHQYCKGWTIIGNAFEVTWYAIKQNQKGRKREDETHEASDLRFRLGGAISSGFLLGFCLSAENCINVIHLYLDHHLRAISHRFPLQFGLALVLLLWLGSPAAHPLLPVFIIW